MPAPASFKGLDKSAKEDNASPDGKLLLRRYFLDTYHAGPDVTTKPIVLDCCQAEGKLWSTLRREYAVTYWGVDRIPRRGRLAIDSSRLLEVSGLPYDIIDVDTYGSPWKHWANLLPNLVKPATVFLTLGQAGGLSSVDGAVLHAMGLSRLRTPIPTGLRWKLDKMAVDSCLSMSYLYQVRIADAQEVMPPSRNARYFGLRLIPNT